MAYPYTESGYNMFDMLSMLQKAIRRGDFEHAGFAADQLKGAYRSTMWNRLFVISAEDCFGILTKELVELRKRDERSQSNQLLGNAVALMCRSKKSRDACYFACNFVLASRNPRKLEPARDDIIKLYRRTKWSLPEESGPEYDMFGFSQMSMFESPGEPGARDEPDEDRIPPNVLDGAILQMAIKHLDMDMIGYQMDVLRRVDRNYLWEVFLDYARCNAPRVVSEISALLEADNTVNKRKKTLEKDEIFISKAAMILCYSGDPSVSDQTSSDIVSYDHLINWSGVRTMPIEKCRLKNGGIPEWVYDCHTVKGRKMGKTDWDMTMTEQNALYPLRRTYFDDASWLYTYEQDYANNSISLAGISLVREYAKTHPDNPVQFIPYE